MVQAKTITTPAWWWQRVTPASACKRTPEAHRDWCSTETGAAQRAFILGRAACAGFACRAQAFVRPKHAGGRLRGGPPDWGRTLGTPFSMSLREAADSAQRKARRQATRMPERRMTAGSLTTPHSCEYADAMPSTLSSRASSADLHAHTS